MLTLYPAITPYTEYKLKVDDIHTLHVEECGIPDGIPVLFLHGGPGAGCNPDHRRFFDPKRYRIILFDQRGCGKSTPHAELKNNTILDLSNDMELLREHCNIEQWVLFGGSWGTTLALYYAQRHSIRVSAMILRGVFLLRKEDLTWFYQDGASKVYPEYWDQFIAHLPVDKRSNILHGYHEILTGTDDVARMAAAKAWSRWEAACATLDLNQHLEEQMTQAHIALSLARIETHYFINNSHISDAGVLTKPANIANIPGVIVHGRYDMVCPADNAYALSKAWPRADLEIIRNAGHSSGEPGIVDALVAATNRFAS